MMSSSSSSSDVTLSFGDKILYHESERQRQTEMITHLTHELELLKSTYQSDYLIMQSIRSQMQILESELLSCQQSRDHYLSLHTESLLHRRDRDLKAENAVLRISILETKLMESDLKNEESMKQIRKHEL